MEKMTLKCSPIVRESNEFRVTDLHDSVQLLPDSTQIFPDDSELVYSVPDAFARTVENFPNHNALMFKDEITKEWNRITYREYKNRVEMMAKVFIKLGLEKHGVVAVLAFNCVEWFVSELAAMHAGLVFSCF
jgi:long-subunit acyl-CoA synthetase (AMP-forming)